MSQVTVEDILDAMDGAIKTIDGIISSLNDLESEMKTFDKLKTAGKTVGTAANVLGAGLTVGAAFFTGGASLLVGGLVATAVGTANNLVCDFVDREETKKCMEKIQRLVDKFVRDAENIQKLFETFKAEMKSTIEDLMKKFNLDYYSATLLALGGGSNSNFTEGKILMSGASFLAKSISAVRFTAAEMEILGMISGVTFSATKGGISASASASAANAGFQTAGKVIGAGAAIISVVLVTVEVVNLVESLFTAHITVSKIQEIRSKLKTEKANVRKTSLGIKAMRMKLAKESLKLLMQKPNRRNPRGDGDSDSDDDDDDDDGIRVITVTYIVHREDIRNGKPVSTAVQEFIREIGAPGDHAGHLRARMFNGSGTDFTNFVPMNPRFNQSEFKIQENRVRSALENNDGAYAEVTIKLYYNLKGRYPLKPFKIEHHFKIVYPDRQPEEMDSSESNF